MMNDVFDSPFFRIIFGFGLGSTMQEWTVIYNNVSYSLRSHSGLLSLFYEHGLFLLLLLGVMFYKFLFKFNFNYENIGIEGKRHAGIYNIFLLLFLFLAWLILNTFYTIAINVPDYGHQTQLISLLLLGVYLNKVIFSQRAGPKNLNRF